MFFTLSKILWLIVDPGNLLLLLLCLGAVLLWTPWRRGGRRLVVGVAIAGVMFATLPMGAMLLAKLENRFPVVTELPESVDGIISLGGMVNQFVTKARGQAALNGAVERLTEFAVLGRRYPDAKLVFTGGSGDVFRQHVKEADVLGPTLKDVLGMDPDRLVFENQSRNTHENAVFTHKLIQPKPGETWILVTSAFHMPRAAGSFRKAGWRIIPFPVDFNYTGDDDFGFSFSFGAGIRGFGLGLHEWVGLVFYWLTDKTEAFFPAPGG
jgi:uncharacterized SAM-binding protein YcdF (DUF218 family)